MHLNSVFRVCVIRMVVFIVGESRFSSAPSTAPVHYEAPDLTCLHPLRETRSPFWMFC